MTETSPFHHEASRAGAAGSRASVRGHPVHPMLVPIPVGAFVFLVISDIAFLFTGDAFFARASFWLIVIGVLGGVAAAVAGLIDYASVRAARNRWGHFHAAGNTLALALAIVNWVIRAGDMVVAIVPWGVVLTLATVAILVPTGWAGGELIYRHRVGVDPIDRR